MITPCSVNDCVKPDLESKVPIADKLPWGVAEPLIAEAEVCATGAILTGTNGEAPAFNNTIVDFYVDVFRSKAQIPDNYGLNDSDFKGTFGFDRYNEAISGKGKQSLSGFEEIGFNGNKYYVPWLCLWPPKKDLGKISDIDKNYIPVTSAKLTFKNTLEAGNLS